VASKHIFAGAAVARFVSISPKLLVSPLRKNIQMPHAEESESILSRIMHNEKANDWIQPKDDATPLISLGRIRRVRGAGSPVRGTNIYREPRESSKPQSHLEAKWATSGSGERRREDHQGHTDAAKVPHGLNLNSFLRTSSPNASIGQHHGPTSKFFADLQNLSPA
jgi:hypothetical protein